MYGILLNAREALEHAGEALRQTPYDGLPVAPVLYLKTPNTWAADGARVAVPAGVDALSVNAALGLLIGAPATRLREEEALEAVLGYVLAIELSIPHASLHRPAVKHRCGDGFLPMGAVVDRGAAGEPDQLAVELGIDGEPASRLRMDRLVRPVRRLLADVTEFMSLEPGDLLLAGLSPDPARAGPGAEIAVEAAGLGRVSCSLVAEEGEA